MNRLTGSFCVGLCGLTLAAGASVALADLPSFHTNDNRLPTPQVPHNLIDPPANFGVGDNVALYSLQLQAKDPDQVEAPVVDSRSGHLTLDSFFDIFYELDMSIGLGPVFPAMGSGQMHVVGQNEFIPNLFVTLYRLELTELNLFPPDTTDPLFPLMLRESPTLASTGSITLIDTCPFCVPPTTTFSVTSFFVVFAEISFDGGQTWEPSNGSFRIAQGVPEPSAWLLVVFAALPVLRTRRCA